MQIDVKPFDKVVISHVPQVHDPRKADWLHALQTMVKLCCVAYSGMLTRESLDVSMYIGHCTGHVGLKGIGSLRRLPNNNTLPIVI